MKPAIPIKITEEKYADKLLSGQIYMRALSKFGVWNKNKSKELDNNFRGDLREGSLKTFKSVAEVQPGIDPRFASIVHDVSIVDDTELKYLKLFCLYGLRYCQELNCFFKPDENIKEFGDTAVVFIDFEEFLKRLYLTIEKKYNGHCLFLIDDVDYCDFDETKELYPGFSKHKSYSYQNEIRVAVAQLEKNNFAINQAEDEYSMVLDEDDLLVEIGDISDIAFKIPIKELLELKINRPLKFPMSINNGPKTFVDHVIEETKKQLKDYKSIGPVTLLVAI